MRPHIWKLLFLVLANLANITSAIAAESEQADTHLSGSAEMRTYFINESFEEARSVGIGLRGNLSHRLSDEFDAKISITGNFDSGSSQDTFNSEYKPQQGFVLNEASLNWRPSGDFHMSAGAINQEWLASPLLVGAVAFPGAFADWRVKWGKSFVEFTGEEAIPTSDTTNSVPQGNEALPTAAFGRVTLGYGDSDYLFKAHVGHYEFDNLPSGVASQSRIRGNSVTGVGDQGSAFIYNFSGIETGASAEGSISDRVSAKLDATYITNLRAPLNLSQGTLIAFETDYKASDRVVVAPLVQWFRNESDSSPAYYDNQQLAHNNRQGIGLGTRIKLPVNHLEITGSWIHANVINPNPAQANFSGVLFSLRKNYDFF